MKSFRILLDLDQVLADFVAGAAFRWGLSTAYLLENWEPGTYPMNAALARALRLEDVTDEQFWGKINRDAGFWSTLAPLPWFKDLTTLVEGVTNDWHVVSSPSHCETSYAGKVTWLKRAFGPKFNRFALTPHKEIFAQPGVILVDDYEKNCEAFAEAGGQAVLFPCHHNHLHRHKDDPLPVVRAALEGLLTPCT